MACARRHFERAVFRAIERWETVEDRVLAPQSINLIVKRRCAAARLDPKDFSAAGLTAGRGLGSELPEAKGSPSTNRSSRRPSTTMAPFERAGKRRGLESSFADAARLVGRK